jgi:hypothetical protein
VYVRRVKDRVLDFNHRGWLYEESFTLYDYETDSLWVQATGKAVAGPLQGTQLERLPATQSTWQTWRRLHSDTRVLARVLGRNSEYHRDSYTRNYETGQGIMYQRAHPVQFGLGLILPGEQKLYPFAVLAKTPVVSDQVAGQAVLVVYHSASRTAVAFEPRYQGRLLDFVVLAPQESDILLTDRQTKSVWSGLTGLALSGPAKGERLRQWTTTQWVVENWPLHYPKGAIYTSPK